MSTLWTPDGEHRISRDRAPASDNAPSDNEPNPGAASRQPLARGPLGEGRDLEDAEISEAELREIAQSLLTAPVEDVISNHCYGLFELAALHLSARPPNLEAARTAVDAMGAVVEGLGSRLGQHQATLSEGLAQLRLTWVRIAEAATAPTNGSDVD